MARATTWLSSAFLELTSTVAVAIGSGAVLAVMALATPGAAQSTADGCLAPDGTARGAPGAVNAPLAVSKRVPAGRIFTFADLGYSDWIDFSSLEGERDFYFPVPAGPWLQAMRLVLPYQATSAVAAERALTVFVGERIVHQTIVTNDTGRIVVPLALDDVHNGVVRVRFVYQGARTNNRCFDRRIVGDYFKLAPDGGLQMDIRSAASMPVGVLATLLPRDLTVILPPDPSPVEAAAALTVVATRGGGQIVLSATAAPDETTNQGIVSISGENAPALSVKPSQCLPILAVGGPDPAAAVRMAFSSWNGLLATSTLSDGTILTRNPEALKFSDLGVDSRAVSVVDGAHEWVFSIPAGRLPAGKRIAALSIAVASAAGGPEFGGVLSAWVNGRMIASTPLTNRGVTHLRAEMPRGASSALNFVKLRIDGTTRRDDCGEAPRGFPAQLLVASEVVLADAGPMADFHDFTTAANEGVAVVLPDASYLALAARAIVGLAGKDVPITVNYGSDLPHRCPCVFIGEAPPPNATPRLSFDNGRMVLRDKDGTRLLDLPGMETLTTAQLMRVGDQAVVWIKPAADRRLPASMWLDQGDIAFADAQGIVKATSTVRSRLDEPEPPASRLNWGTWIARNIWWEVAGLILVALVLGIGLWALRRPPKQ